MANVKKSFNFRHGVQVDDDNFIINPNGLVGIGSTIPTESLDVQGNIRLRGTLYADRVESNVILNTSDTGSVDFKLINVGVTSIKSGIITSFSGIVTYYGDGSNLQGLPTSQWVDVNPALNEYTSIYASGNVGIATINPIYTLQIGGNYSLESFANGVGIASEGDIKATRDITIGRNLNVVGIATIGSNLIITGFGSIRSNLSVTGITTSYSFSGFGTDITGINASNITNGTLNNARLSDDINKPTGIATFNVFSGSLVGIATTARGLTNDANIDIISIISDRSDLGITTSSSLNVTSSLGIGTNNPNSDVHIRRIGSNAELQITSDSNIAQIILGKDIALTSNNTIFQFNDISGSSHPQSGENCFDIINYAPGNFNTFIRPESTPDLKFNWINRSTNAVLMSLTSGGNLGLGKTNPSLKLEVVGISTVTSNSFVGGDFSVSGSITGSSLNVTGTTTLNSTRINASVGIFANSPNYTLQIGDSLNSLGTSGTGVGISSSGNVVVSGIITASKFIGIGSNLTSLTPESIVPGTITNVNLNSLSGVVTASKFIGIGSNLTSLTPENIVPGTITDVNINSVSGVVTTGILTASTLYGDGSNITELAPENINSGSFNGLTYVFPNSSLGIGTEYTGFNDLIVKNIGFISGIATIDAQSGTSIVIDQTSNDTFKFLEYSIHFEYPNKIQVENILVTHNNVSSSHTSYASINLPSKIVTINTTVDEGFTTLEVTPQSGINGLTTYRYLKRVIYS